MNKNFCFCTLAMGERYRAMAGQLARDLEGNFPGGAFIVLTDEPRYFKGHSNVVAFKHRQRGVFSCYNDKRFVMAKALSLYRTAICFDCDMRITKTLPEAVNFLPGISGCGEALTTHVRRNRPERLERITALARKLDIPLEGTNWIGESLWSVTRDEGRECDFLKCWDVAARYAELHGIHDGEGVLVGMATRKAGWTLDHAIWASFNACVTHLDASERRGKSTFWQSLKKRLGYHYRLNKARLLALRDFDFYYR